MSGSEFVNFPKFPEVSSENGRLAMSFFRSFLEERVIDDAEMRERVIVLGEIASLLLEGLQRAEVEVRVFTNLLNDQHPVVARDKDVIKALNAISTIQYLRSKPRK